jgi:hypothetical protein
METLYTLHGNQNPCRHCVPPTRKPGCHSQCPEYIAWKKDHDETKEKIRKEKEKFYNR